MTGLPLISFKSEGIPNTSLSPILRFPVSTCSWTLFCSIHWGIWPKFTEVSSFWIACVSEIGIRTPFFLEPKKNQERGNQDLLGSIGVSSSISFFWDSFVSGCCSTPELS